MHELKLFVSSLIILFYFFKKSTMSYNSTVLFFFSLSKFHVFIYLSFLLCLGGILDSHKHLLTVILAPGSADTDCQRDVSFLLFISSFLRDAAECKSAFSPCRVVVGR